MVTNGVFLKFGPFPEFDQYIINVFEKIDKIKIIYNPMTPKEDIYNLYRWATSYNYSQLPDNENQQWSVTVQLEESGQKYYRSLKP